MCKAVQEYAERYAKNRVKEYAEQYAKDCAEQERIDAICNMTELGLTKEQVLKKYSEAEYAQAEQVLETAES